MDRVTTGLRPKWPSNNPLQGLADVLWGQIKACWKQEPKERPTAPNVLETLLALGETQHHKSVVSVNDTDDETMIGELKYVEGTYVGLGVVPGLTLCWFTAIPSPKESKAHYNLSNLSGSTLVSSSLSDSKAPDYRGSDAHKSGESGHRSGEHMPGFLHLPRHATAPVARRELVERPKPTIEIIDRREEKVTVREDRVAYLVSRPIPKGKTLKKVVITVVSKDQGWSSYQDDHGTYRGSWTWFEFSIGPSEDSEKWCGEVVRNLHAHGDFKEHTVEITDGELYEKAKSGDILTVWALAKYSGWKNTVKEATIRYVVS